MMPLPLTTPLVILGSGAVLVYLLARVITRQNQILASATFVVFAMALASMLPLAQEISRGELIAWPAVERVLHVEPGGLLVSMLALGLGMTVSIFSGEYLALDRRPDRYYPLLLLMLAGTVGMAMATDLFVLYLFVVLTNASSYILVAFRRQTETAIEAGFKYATTSTMGSIMFLAGIAFVFRSSGTLSLPMQRGSFDFWSVLGTSLISFGLLVKAALFPAHVWLPDAHGRAPSSVSALLSGIVVPAHLYVLVKTGQGLGAPHPALGWILVGLAFGSMVVGNAMALRQSYGKRLLGYSTVAQCGYMALAMGLGLVYQEPEPVAAGLVLLAAHGQVKSLAFLAKGILHFYCNATKIEDLDALAKRAPLACGLFTVGLLGLAGIPPLVGFVAKFGILMGLASIDRSLAWVATAVYLINSLASFGYYMPLIGRLLRTEAETKPPVHPSPWMQAPVVVLGMAALLFGVWPSPVWRLAEQAALFIVGWGQ